MDDRQNESSTSQKSSELIVSDDSQYAPCSSADQNIHSSDIPPKTSETEQKTSASNFSSDALIPHPSTSDATTIQRSLIDGQNSSQSEKTVAESITEAVQLTAEIFASGAIPAGTMLGHFMIKSYIGGGGMGRVYLANDTALDRNVAVKVLPRQRANDQSTVARFMNEAKSAARLNHEHIAQVYFAGEQDGIPFIVFEYVEGTNIRSMVDDYDAFPLPQALNYLIQIAHALAHAADHGVVHRDVKPSNILITREGRAKLIDMGLARLLDPSQTKDDLTASGVTLGTFDYISPEQARDPRNADIRSDIYSLGCTFFFMLSGRPPFPEGTVLQKLLQHQGDEPPDIRSFQPNIPAEVAVLMQKMMAKDPRQRFQTPTALIDALVHVAKMIGLQPTGPGKLNWVMSTPSQSSQFLKHVPWLTAITILFGAYFLFNLYWQQIGKSSNIIPSELTTQFQKDDPRLSVAPLENTEIIETINSTIEKSGHTQQGLKAYFDLISLSTEQFDRDLEQRFPSLFNDSQENPIDEHHRARFPERERLGGGISASTFSGQLMKQNYSGTLGLLAYLKDIKPLTSMTPPMIPVEPEKILNLCVDPTGLTPDSFKTLAAALAKADKGATIELKWNDMEKIDPFALTGRQLNFLAADGYRPIMRFEPSSSLVASQSSRTMITLRTCHLIFQDIGIEMNINQDDMGLQWTLFELIDTNDIRFQNCTLTIRNAANDNSAYHQQVAFFRNSSFTAGLEQIPLVSSIEKSDPISTPIDMENFSEYGILSVKNSFEPIRTISVSNNDKQRLKIQMSDSILRGEATCFRCDKLQDTEFIAQNSLFALAKPFVRLEDSGRTTPSESEVRILFDRVSYYGLQPFVRQNRNSFETEPMRLEIETNRSVFFLNDAPLAVFRGASSRLSAFDYLKWSGRNYYFQNISLGWKFQPDTSRPDGGIAYDMPLSEWNEIMNPRTERDATQLPQIDQLIFEEIKKPAHLVHWRDLRPVFSSDSTLSEEEKRMIGASPPESPLSKNPNEAETNLDRRPIQTDYGRVRFE